MRGEKLAKLFQESQDAAIARIEELVAAHKLDCNFRRLDAYLFPAPGMEFSEARRQQDDEYAALRKLDVKVAKAKGVPFEGYMRRRPSSTTRTSLPSHPLRYLRGLAAAMRGERGAFLPAEPGRQHHRAE